jgi:type IV pilus assembly protein PilW
MKNKQLQINLKQVGFSLIELLVGLIIGLLTTLVIMQVFSVFEGQKRTTSGTTDAQTNGSIGLYSLQRDVQLAGFGLPLFDQRHMPLNCTDTVFNLAAVAAPAMSATTANLVPITITDRASSLGGDTIAVRYGNSTSGGVPMLVTSSSAGTTVALDTSVGCAIKDTVIAVTESTCVVTRVTGFTVPNKVNISPAITVDIGSDPKFSTRFSCVGMWNDVTYSVSGTQLIKDSTPDGVANGTPIVDGIVSLQAQYGISAANNQNQVAQWVDATGIWANTATTPSLANRNRIKAVRVAIIARNGLLEKGVVSAGCSSTTNPNPTGVCAWDATSASPTTASPAPTVDLTHLADWNRYRYKVYESVIPLRNMIWAKDRL